MSAWFGDARDLSTAMPRVIERAQSRATDLLRRIEDEPARLLAPALNLMISLPIALLIGVPTAGVGAGVLIGLLIAGSGYFAMRARERAASDRLAQAVADAWSDADQRVALVTKQYEWAVNDVANLRDALRRTQTRVIETERQLHQHKRTDAVLPLVRGHAAEDAPTTLRFETDGIAPSQVRILEGGAVVGISARAIEPATGDVVTFLVRVSERIAAAVTAGDQRFALEGLVGEDWRRVVIRREHNVRSVSDKRGRVFAVPTDEAPRLAITLAED